MNDLITPIKARLSAMSQAEREAVANELGISFSSVQKIATGETTDPRYSTWSALAGYFGIACAVPREPTFCDGQ